MTIDSHCSGCSKLLRIPDQAAGEPAKYPDCGTLVDASAASSSPPPAPATDLSTFGGRLIILSLVAYGFSFILPAFNSNESSECVWGIEAYFLGLFGLLLLQPTWLANPALWVGLICAARRSWKKAAVCGVMATGFALVALLLYQPGAAPASHGCTSLSLSGGWTAQLTQLLPGFSCWLASMVLFALGSTLKLLSVARNRQKQTDAAGT